jgi:hypothetical protein
MVNESMSRFACVQTLSVLIRKVHKTSNVPRAMVYRVSFVIIFNAIQPWLKRKTTAAVRLYIEVCRQWSGRIVCQYNRPLDVSNWINILEC